MMRNTITALVCAALLMSVAVTSSVEAQRSGAYGSGAHKRPVTADAAAQTAAPAQAYAPCSEYNPCATVSPALDAIPADATVRQMPAQGERGGAAGRPGRGSKAQGQDSANAAPGDARSGNPCERGGNSGGRGRGGNAGGGFGNGAGGGADDPAAAARRAAFRARMAANPDFKPGAGGAFPCGNRAGGSGRGGAQAASKPD